MAEQNLTAAWSALAADAANARIVNVVRGDVWVFPASTVGGPNPGNRGWKLGGPILIPATSVFSFRGVGTIDVVTYVDQRPQQP